MAEHKWEFYSDNEREWAKCMVCDEMRYKDIGERLTNKSLMGECSESEQDSNGKVK